MSRSKVNIGGQAVIEGVMMRSPTYYATAVRTPQGRIVIQKTPYVGLTHRFKFLNIPIIRGAINLIETLFVGIRSLSFSASQAVEEEEKDRSKKSGGSTLAIFGSIVLALGLGISLFFYLPLVLTELTPVKGGLAFNLLDGAFRLAIFLLYIYLVSRWKEMRRIFQYHGAEHKTIFAFEAGKDLTTETAKEFSTLHPRCGTSFLIVVMLVSIIVFIFLGRPDSWSDRLLRFAMIPLIGGISFEFVKLSSKESFSRIVKPAVWPGLALQKITTQEPSEDMLEVAIAALDACLDYKSVKLELPST
ncbi:MAG: DUF1385 domain-containing protein [Candidatus Latescibacteria bacterium]|nr:DUF1385 domain-containing protein [Candidatus Latescibacterota bacterium]NIM22586.1 DUF1385 domain-containing protein [Candidatus Latescibacterota bacterium]NIM64875.1 DUF1385 domain-containing protein [Candidatus Latescibacterota bacterium]NIO01390.1 DUF1385 domain-containing protein [Candidatus Latescibacterota bacterium]NIO27900.1 DUF1385 domain-containing protein [Candidatus Latescibacterota bacterium]